MINNKLDNVVSLSLILSIKPITLGDNEFCWQDTPVGTLTYNCAKDTLRIKYVRIPEQYNSTLGAPIYLMIFNYAYAHNLKLFASTLDNDKLTEEDFGVIEYLNEKYYEGQYAQAFFFIKSVIRRSSKSVDLKRELHSKLARTVIDFKFNLTRFKFSIGHYVLKKHKIEIDHIRDNREGYTDWLDDRAFDRAESEYEAEWINGPE